jgi:hypothetical protein
MAGALTISTLKDSSGVLATQNGMTGICKAWVNFNGTGTPAIRGSFNVSSITDNGTGDYTVNFTNAMPNTTYSVSGSANMTDNPASADADDGVSYGPIVYATTSIRGVVARTNAAQDAINVNVQVFSS